MVEVRLSGPVKEVVTGDETYGNLRVHRARAVIVATGSAYRSLGLEDCAFTRKPSVYLASSKKDVLILRKESEARREMGTQVSVVTVRQPGRICRPAK